MDEFTLEELEERLEKLDSNYSLKRGKYETWYGLSFDVEFSKESLTPFKSVTGYVDIFRRKVRILKDKRLDTRQMLKTGLHEFTHTQLFPFDVAMMGAAFCAYQRLLGFGALLPASILATWYLSVPVRDILIDVYVVSKLRKHGYKWDWAEMGEKIKQYKNKI